MAGAWAARAGDEYEKFNGYLAVDSDATAGEWTTGEREAQKYAFLLRPSRDEAEFGLPLGFDHLNL